MPHVEQELFTLPEHMNSHPDFSKVRVAWYLMFCVVFYWSLFVLFLFLLAIVLSVFLWITFTFGYCIVCISLNYFFFWPLYCLSFFELLLPITPLVSSNYTWDKIYDLNILFICFTWHRKCFQKKQTVYWLYSKIIALISDNYIDIWLLHCYLIIALIYDYYIDIWLLHWYLIIALISDYCIDIWLLHWYLIQNSKFIKYMYIPFSSTLSYLCWLSLFLMRSEHFSLGTITKCVGGGVWNMLV